MARQRDWKSLHAEDIVESLAPIELLQLHGRVVDELVRKTVVRTRNNPVSGYTEWLVIKAFHLEAMPNSNKGYDALDRRSGEKYEVKGRQLPRRQLGVIRNLRNRNFDLLAAVLLSREFYVEEAYLIPYGQIAKLARFSEHQNGHILVLPKDIASMDGIVDIAEKLRRLQ